MCYISTGNGFYNIWNKNKNVKMWPWIERSWPLIQFCYWLHHWTATIYADNLFPILICLSASVVQFLRTLYSKYAWTFSLKWSKVKCKYTNRKPMYDTIRFISYANSNLYRGWHCCPENHVWSSEILWIGIFVLQVNQGCEVKRHRLRHRMAISMPFSMPYILVKKMADLFLCGPPIRHTH